MIIIEGSRLAINTIIVRADDHSKKLNKVTSFDTESKEAIIYASLVYSDGGSCVATKRDKYSTEKNLSLSDGEYKADVVKVKVTLLGHVAIDKRTGEIIG